MSAASAPARSRRLGVAAAVVDGRRVPGDVEVAGGRVTRVGAAPPAGGGRGVAIPGLVDLQVNGYGGVDLLHDADDDAWADCAERLLADGVTTWQPTLVTAPEAALADGLRRAQRVARRRDRHRVRALPRALGVHLEGPFLSPARLGAHAPEHRRDPDPALLERLLAVGGVTAVTLAPELPGAEALVARLAGAGVVVSLGHSEASAAQAAAAVALGARSVTHLFNAMPGIGGRAPGLAGFALGDARVAVQAIVDGVHLAEPVERLVLAAAGSRLVLVSDAMAAAGMGDGRFRLAEADVTVEAGRATRADGTLAGSARPLIAALRRAVALGLPLERAVEAASAAPARLAGRPELGRLAPGAPADVVVLDDDLQIARVLRAGAEHEPGAA